MKIVHVAWLGRKNFGDDIMYESFSSHLKSEFGEYEHCIWCDQAPIHTDNPEWIYKQPNQNGIIKRMQENRALKKADYLIIGGGSILHSYHSSKWKKRGAVYLKKKNKKSKALGVGLSVGPFDSAEDEKACVEFLMSIDACAFRDLASYDFAKNLSLPYKPILAFDLLGGSRLIENIDRRTSTGEIKTVGIAIRKPYRVDKELVLKQYQSLVERLAQTFQSVMIFSFSNDEIQLAAYLEKTINKKNTIIVTYNGNTADLIKKVNECDFFISSKLHGGILAFLLNIPFALISYQKKFKDFANYIKLPENYVFDQENFKASEVYSRIGSYKLPSQNEFIALAKKNFEIFNF